MCERLHVRALVGSCGCRRTCGHAYLRRRAFVGTCVCALAGARTYVRRYECLHVRVLVDARVGAYGCGSANVRV